MKKVLTLDEASEYLRYKKNYLYKLTSKGLIPHLKPNGKIFFCVDKLDAWLKLNEIKTRREINEEAMFQVRHQTLV